MYWSRAELKARAKQVMRGSYLPMLLVSLILFIVNGGGAFLSMFIMPNEQDIAGWANTIANMNYTTEELYAQVFLYLMGFFAIYLIVMLFVECVRIFIGYNLIAGGSRYFLGLAQGADTKISVVGSTMRRKEYINVFITMFMMNFFIGLWSLLLFVPGLIKAYAYSMTPYILADNPNMLPGRAITLSRQMTRGEKWNIFVLDLSFIGWYLLVGIAAGIAMIVDSSLILTNIVAVVGVLIISPYPYAARAGLYLKLREKAISEGFTSAEELNIVVEPIEDETEEKTEEKAEENEPTNEN